MKKLIVLILLLAVSPSVLSSVIFTFEDQSLGSLNTFDQGGFRLTSGGSVSVFADGNPGHVSGVDDIGAGTPSFTITSITGLPFRINGFDLSLTSNDIFLELVADPFLFGFVDSQRFDVVTSGYQSMTTGFNVPTGYRSIAFRFDTEALDPIGSVRVDNISFSVIPEPNTIYLMFIVLTMILALRMRSSIFLFLLKKQN